MVKTIINSFLQPIYYRIFFCILTISQPALTEQQPSNKEWIKASTISALGFTALLGLRLAPASSCSWCNTNQFDVSISRALQWDNIAHARINSDVVAFGLLPVLSLSALALGSGKTAPLDILTVIASLSVTAAVTELVKITASRTRPDRIFGLADHSHESNRSFFSGHTSFAFALATSSSLILHRRNIWWAPYFAATSAIAASFVGYARIAGLRHFPTDVLCGMGVGIAMGALLPSFILESEQNITVGIQPDMSVQISMVW